MAMDLLLRMAGFGANATAPHWLTKCSPAETSMVEELLELGQTREKLRQVIRSLEKLGQSGHYLVAAAVLAVKDCCSGYDSLLIDLTGKLQSAFPPTLRSIYVSTKEQESLLAACLGYLTWMAESNKPEELYVGRLLDECCRRMNVSHGGAKNATDAIFKAMFEAFKRMLVPWLAYGLIDSRADTFFIKEPVDCKMYFKEIGPVISDPQKAPSHFTIALVEQIAQYGYMRKFLGWRSKNVLKDADLEDDLTVLASELRSIAWQNYKSSALEIVVSRFGKLYSRALYVDIFERCQIVRILRTFHQMFLLSAVDIFDEFIVLTDPILSRLPVAQTCNEVNVRFDRCFENSRYTRTYHPSIVSSSFPVEQTAAKEFDCVYFTLTASHAPPETIGWNCLLLEFKIQNPLDWFFHPKAVKKYKTVFRLLLRLKRLMHAFSNVWKNLRKARWSSRLDTGDYVELFHWHYNYVHIFTAVQEFIQVDVINVAWIDFHRKIGEIKDYVRLVEVHESFLAQIITNSCIENDNIRRCLVNMIETSLKICGDINIQILKPATAEVNIAEIRDEMLNLDTMLRLFMQLVASATEFSNPMLPYLNLKLNFTGRLLDDTHLY